MSVLRTPSTVVAIAVAVIGVVYAFVVPPGLPYDEPSHWRNVLYIAETGTLPRVGAAGVSYEAVQGPLSYVVAGALVWLLDLVGAGRDVALDAVRVLGVGWLVGLAMTTYALVRELAHSVRPWSVALGTGIVVGSPVLAAVGSSVQNDVPSVVLAAGALLVLARGWDQLSTRRSGVAGALLGLAFLAKASVWPVGAVLAVALVVRRLPRQLAGLVAAGLAVSGWWVVRNLVLYDSLTGNNAVEAAGFDFSPIGINGPQTLVDLARPAVTYLWLPVEYWRNAVSSPTWADGLVILLVLVVLAGALVRSPSRPSGPQAICIGVAVAAASVWALTHVFVQTAAFRLAYVATPVWAWATVAALARSRSLAVLLGGGFVALHVLCLTEVLALPG